MVSLNLVEYRKLAPAYTCTPVKVDPFAEFPPPSILQLQQQKYIETATTCTEV